MRTPGQGQAAVPEERVNRRRSPPPAWAADPGPRDKILRTVTFVERYPEVLLPRFSAERGPPVLPWARFAFMVFCCASAPGEMSCVLVVPVELIFGGK